MPLNWGLAWILASLWVFDRVLIRHTRQPLKNPDQSRAQCQAKKDLLDLASIDPNDPYG